MDGWITIGTKLDSKELEKSLKNEENKLKRFEKEAEKLLNKKVKIEMDLQQIEASKVLLKEVTDEELKTAQTQEQVDAILKDEAIQAKILDESYKSTNKELGGINKKINDNAGMQEVTKQNIEEITQKMQNLKNVSKFKGTIDNIGTSIQNVTKKVVRWGLAVFGVRSAYMIVRQAMSTLSQYDEQLAADIQYIRFAIAMTLERFIKPLVEWIFKLLQYVNYLTMAWFKLNLFEKATVSAFNKSNKSAEKLKKTLAGFDEMNILSDNNSNSSDIGGIPSQDLSNMQNFKAPKWLEWIKDHGEEIKNIIIGIAAALALIKFADLLTWGAELTGILGGLMQIGIIVIGVELLYTALTGRELISDIKEIIKGLEDLKKIREDSSKQSKSTKKNTKELIKTYKEAEKTVGVTKEQTKNYVDTLLNGVETNDSLVKSLEKQKSWLGVLNGDNQKINKTQKTYNETIKEQLDELKRLYDNGQLNTEQTKKYKEMLEKQIYTVENSNTSLSKNSEEYKENTKKVKELKDELERITGKKYEIKSYLIEPRIDPVQRVINELMKGFGIPVEFIVGKIGSSGGGYSSGGGRHGATGLMYYPKLAVGGIINKPGTGVPYRNSIIGERGMEAVVPLTDSQQMALLGEAIGKYITVNATIVNSMNGRVLNRELQKIQNQTSFAMNGR